MIKTVKKAKRVYKEQKLVVPDKIKTAYITPVICFLLSLSIVGATIWSFYD